MGIIGYVVKASAAASENEANLIFCIMLTHQLQHIKTGTAKIVLDLDVASQFTGNLLSWHALRLVQSEYLK
jgi:hypothetical protein